MDNQESINTDIYEGERKQCKYNFKIGNIKLNLKNQNSREGYKIKANIEDIVAEAKRHKEEDDEFEMLIQTWTEFKRQIYCIKHSVEDDKSMSNSDKEQVFEIVNEYLTWAKGIPEPMELYKTEMEKFVDKIREYYPSVDEILTLNRLTRDFLKQYIAECENVWWKETRSIIEVEADTAYPYCVYKYNES
ncbi:hypothetical protein WR25_16241 [Diploscapter pachys]|uniref:Uncharacterized protein n=1 Tax=Diploscapter pachys TaxID=2018661 RepID=A0A2A2KNM2_9BILA|nr:hypothetical protein WR25_16241 [Diploscapter pachys]